MKHSARGFTLIELLVVIAIIGILSSIVLTSLNSARANANDVRRISDLKELQKSLEGYYNDTGAYPLTTSAHAWYSVCAGTAASSVIPGLISGKYISAIPTDPNMVTAGTLAASTCCYLYGSDGINYKLMVGENCPVSNYANASLKSLLDPERTSSIKDWTVYSGPIQSSCPVGDTYAGCW